MEIQNKLKPVHPVQRVAAGQNKMVDTLGMFVLSVFLFLLLGRICDFYLSTLHVPLIVSLIALFLAVLGGRFLMAIRSPISLIMLGLTFWMVIGTPFSVWRGGSVEVLQGWLKSYVSFLLIIAVVQTVEDGHKILRTFALSTLCVAILALFHSTTVENRLLLTSGLYAGPNEVANAAVLGVITWGYMASQPRISVIPRILYVGLALFVGALLPRTGSRGGLITLGVIVLAWLLRLKPAMRIAATAGCVALTMIALISVPSDVRVRFLGMFSKNLTVSSDQEAGQLLTARASSEERMRLLIDSIIVTLKNPLFGVGLGNFGVRRNEMMLEAGATRGSYQGTHNTFTQISSEAGIPALILFLLSIGFCWRDIRKTEKFFSGSEDPESVGIRRTAFVLRLLLLSYVVIFCFEYIGYDPFYIVVCGLIASFTQAAFGVHAAKQSSERGSPAVAGPAKQLSTQPLLRPGLQWNTAHQRKRGWVAPPKRL